MSNYDQNAVVPGVSAGGATEIVAFDDLSRLHRLIEHASVLHLGRNF